MKKIISPILITLFCIHSNAQTETKAYKSVADSFEKHYNASDYEAIFNLFSTSMQEALPLEQTKQTLESLKAQFGNILEKEFSRYDNSYAVYKTTFDNIIFGVSISIDSDSKINGLYFRPYEDDKLPKLERNSTKLILPFKDQWTVTWGG